ncbi:transposase [Halosimplex carlsbadense 2-9-1]|uniref:Transposase n=1 Tax=Halosimplex carlsbadense 2-9-1 TaxID=797114 RepID=M0CY40_9EURY|nr:transposase [Halosimplex carlsbadense 2-9-1]
MDAKIAYIDQTEKSVQIEPRVAWFSCGTRPNVELSGQQDWTCLLGAIAEDGKRSFSWFVEYVTAIRDV